MKRNTHLSSFDWRGCHYVAECCHSSRARIYCRTVISPLLQDVRAAYVRAAYNELLGNVCDFGGRDNFEVAPLVNATCVIIQELMFLCYSASFCLWNHEMNFNFSWFRYYATLRKLHLSHGGCPNIPMLGVTSCNLTQQ